jgi:hypothetical protein
VSWWAFTVLGFMVGSCVAGPCPLGDLGGWSRGPIYARICPGTLSRRWYANTPRHIGHEDGAGRSTGRPTAPYIAADLQARIASGQREPGADLPACRAHHSGTESIGTGWPGRRLKRPAGRRVGGSGARNEYIFVRSVLYDPADSVRAQQVAAAAPQIPHAYIVRAVGPAVQCCGSTSAS